MLRGKDIQGLSPEVMDTLMNYDFPGNIRELENIIEYATVVCQDSLIRYRNLPENLRHLSDQNATVAVKDLGEKALSLDAVEKDFIYEVLRQNNWNRSAAAAQIGIHPTTLWRKIKRLNLDLPKQNGRAKKNHT